MQNSERNTYSESLLSLKCLPKATMVHKGTTISKFKNCPSVKLVTNIFSHAKKTF